MVGYGQQEVELSCFGMITQVTVEILLLSLVKDYNLALMTKQKVIIVQMLHASGFVDNSNKEIDEMKDKAIFKSKMFWVKLFQDEITVKVLPTLT